MTSEGPSQGLVRNNYNLIKNRLGGKTLLHAGFAYNIIEKIKTLVCGQLKIQETLSGEKVSIVDMIYDGAEQFLYLRPSQQPAASKEVIIRDHSQRFNISKELSVVVNIFSYLFSERRYYKLQLSNPGLTPLSITCHEFGIKNKILGAECCLLDESSSDQSTSKFRFKLWIEILPSPTMIQTSFYSDAEMADFELCAEDGSVKVHKAVLGFASPVFKAMLSNDCKETNEGRFVVPEATKDLLEHFKKYIYLRAMENIGIEDLLKLLRLASCYMMPDLKQVCSRMIQQQFTGEKVWDIFTAVVKYKCDDLLVAILNNMNENILLNVTKDIWESEKKITE